MTNAWKAFLTAAIGNFWIATGFLFLLLYLFFAGFEVAQGQPIEKPGSFAVGIAFVGLVLPPLLLGLLGLGAYESVRVAKRWNVSKAITFSALLLCWGLVLLAYGLRPFRYLTVAESLRALTGDQFFFFLGALIQTGLGFWLLHSKRFAVADKPET